MNGFLYQVGSVTTTTPWTKPLYEKVVRFLQDVDVSNILERYESYIHGGILWDALTWDLDILLKYDWDETTDWDMIEADFNQLNDIALNKHRLLLDVSMANNLYKLPTKQYLLDYQTLTKKPILQPLNIIFSQVNTVNNTLFDIQKLNIIRLYLIKSYRGRAHALGKPVRGQRT